jgi:hypothetical protein
MPSSVYQDDVPSNRIDGGAVSMEVGERLALALGQPPKALSGRLLALIDQLADAQSGQAPQIETDREP